VSQWLARADVIRLTKKSKYGAQKRALAAKEIKFEEAVDGEPLVPVDYANPVSPAARAKRKVEPNWELHR
jgi:hypothetical protein